MVENEVEKEQEEPIPTVAIVQNDTAQQESEPNDQAVKVEIYQGVQSKKANKKKKKGKNTE